MGAQAKKQLSQPTDGGIVVGAGKRRLGPQHRLFLLGLAAIVAVVLIAAFTAVLIRHNSTARSAKVALAFSANGKTSTLSQSYYATLISQAAADKVSAKDARATVIEAYQDKLAAAHSGLALTAEDINQAALVRFNQTDTRRLNDWRRLGGVVAATEGNLLFVTAGGYEGAVVFFPYDTLFVSTVQGYPTPKGYGEASAITSAKQYAQQQATSYHDALAAGKSSLVSVLTSVQKNSRLQFAGGTNDSYSFRVDANGRAYLNGQDVVSKVPDFVVSAIQAQNKVGVTDVQTMTNDFPSQFLATGTTSPVDVAYYFVVVTKVSSPQPNIQKNFDAAVRQVKVTSYDN